MVCDAQGNVYGTTLEGGLHGGGILFEITTDGEEKILHEFCSEEGCADGSNPMGALIMDAKGNIYGTASNGGGAGGNGVIFMFTP